MFSIKTARQRGMQRFLQLGHLYIIAPVASGLSKSDAVYYIINITSVVDISHRGIDGVKSDVKKRPQLHPVPVIWIGDECMPGYATWFRPSRTCMPDLPLPLLATGRSPCRARSRKIFSVWKSVESMRPSKLSQSLPQLRCWISNIFTEMERHETQN